MDKKTYTRRTYLSCRGTCYTFIRKYGTLEDLKAIQAVLANRIAQLEAEAE